MNPWVLRNPSIATFPRLSTSIGSTRSSTRALRHANRLEYSTASPDKPATSFSIKNNLASNVLGSLVAKYRQSTTPPPSHLYEKLETTRRLKAKKALKHEVKELLAAQRKARIGLRLYETLSAQDLSGLMQGLNRFDIRTEIQAQEHDTIPAVQDMAKNDSLWKLETHTRMADSGKDQVNAAVGKRLSKVYRFDGWTLATKHFWKRLNECFEQQDHHGEVNVRFDPDTKLTEVRVYIHTHTPKALPNAILDQVEKHAQSAVHEKDSTGSPDEPQTGQGAKRKIIIGPPALTRKDFILGWSCDIAAFRARQKQALLDRRAAKREATSQETEGGEISVQGTHSTGEGNGDVVLASASLPQGTEDSVKIVINPLLSGGSSARDDHKQRNSPSVASFTNRESASFTTHPAPQTASAPGDLTKRRARLALESDGLSLQHFLSRTQILAEYRKSVRATRTLPDSQIRRETLDWLRQDLEKLKGETDLHTIKEVLSRFRRDSKQFIPSIGLSTLCDGDQGGSRLIGRK